MRSTSLMSNGRYSVMVTATGSGYSRWNDMAITRWQPDPTEDRLGTARNADPAASAVSDPGSISRAPEAVLHEGGRG